MKISVVIAAGGRGERMGRGKQFIKIAGLPMVIASAKVFDKIRSIDEIILAVPVRDILRTRKIVKSFKLKKVRRLIASGEHRQDSVYNGLRAVSPDADYVLIHDGARPFISKDQIISLIAEVRKSKAAILAVPIIDTPKQVKKGVIMRTLDRSALWAAQTPQAFKTPLIKEAHERGRKSHYRATDDADLVERAGHKVKIVMGSYDNIKITTPFDLKLAQLIGRSLSHCA